MTGQAALRTFAEREGATFEVRNPANGDLVGQVANMGAAELDAAVARAKAAFPAWSAQGDAALQQACRAVCAEIADHSEELARLITLEQGKPLNGLGSRWEMGGTLAWARYTSELSLSPRLLQDDSQGRVALHRRPLGVVGSITPWNFPVMIAIWHLMPALRTGNTVVIKPSPHTPLATARLVEIINKVLPEGVLNLVTGDDRGFNLGGAMAAHADIRKIVFTGSCATGQKVMRSAADTMKRLTLELGGNDAGIVLPDADPAAIAEGLFWGAFLNNGQTCAAMKRLYVHASIHDAVCDALTAYARTVPVGDGLDEASRLGPVQNRMQFDKLCRLVADAGQRGRVLLGGAPAEGLFFRPTLIAGLTNGDALVDEEQFGPALPIIRYDSVDEAIALANDSPDGLGGSVWSADIAAAREVAARLECGSVWLNKHGAIQPNAPFGGRKASGLGVEFAEEGLNEYTDIQVIFG
ncbi:aldehyde dehydrogenase family protein [Labrys neptuniae]